MKTSNKYTLGVAMLAAGIFSANHDARAAAFTEGDIVVERIGDGTTTLSSAAAAVSVVEFAPTGTGQTPNNTINLPTTGTTALTDSGSGTSDGYLNLSADRTTIVLPGYRANTATASVATASINRVVGTISANGTANTTTTFNDGYVGNNFRGVASNDGATFFLSGTAASGQTATAGVRTTQFGATTSSSVSIAPQTNLRNIEIYNGGLYYSTGSGGTTGVGIYQVNNNLSTTGGQTAVQLINTSTANPYGFAISPDGKTVYVAEETGGINKYTSSTGTAGSFTLAGTFTASATAARGLAVDFSGTNPVIYATGTATTNNTLFDFTDTGSFTVTPTTLATAGANYVFRGLDFAPTAVPEPATCFAGALGVLTLAWSQRRRLRRA